MAYGYKSSERNKILHGIKESFQEYWHILETIS